MQDTERQKRARGVGEGGREREGGIKSYDRVFAGPSNGLKSKGQSVGYIKGAWSTGQTKQLTLTQPQLFQSPHEASYCLFLYHILFTYSFN